MTLSDRDRRILLILVPIVIVLAYWFLLLSPKRDDLKTAQDAQTAAEDARDQAVAQAAQLEKARQTFAADYAAVVKMGKAIPETIDSPSLLVQLDRASNGTHIDFNSVTFGPRSSTSVTVAQTGASSSPAQPGGNAAAGGAPAQTGVGRATESAGNAVTTGNQASTNVDTASQNAGTTATSTTSTTATTATPAAPATSTAALDTVPLTFNFTGTYFDLADFLHRLKRFVYVTNNQIFVRGRLMTIDTISFAPGGAAGTTTAGGRVSATVGATVYLAPKSQGATGGATPSGPAGTDTTTTTTPSGSQTSSVPLATVGSR